MVFLLLIPLASGLHTPLHPVDELNSVGGQERLLVLEDGVWTSEHWSKLLVDGVQPLRSVRPDALLVWDEGGVSTNRGASKKNRSAMLCSQGHRRVESCRLACCLNRVSP